MADLTHPVLAAIARFEELGHELNREGRDADDAAAAQRAMGAIERLSFDARRVEHEGRFPAEVWAQAASDGLFSLMVPREEGGSGLSALSMSTVATKLARTNGSLAMILCAHNGLAMYPFLRHGSRRLKAEWLPAVSTGEALLAFAMTEPRAGNDLASLSTTVVIEGDRLQLTGEKCFITNGGRARFAVIVARSPGHARGPFSLVFVDLEARGVTRSAEEDKLGLRGVSNVRFQFENVSLPAHHLLGEPGAGWEHAQDALQLGRTLVASGIVGAAQGSLAITRAYLDERHRYGKPLSAIPIVRNHVARAEAQRFALETLVRAAALACDAGELSPWSAIAKVACTELGWQIVDTMLGLHGGLGFMEPTGIARYLRDGRASRIFEGPNDVLRLRLAMDYVLTEAPALRPQLSERCDGPLHEVATRVDHALQRVLEAGSRLRATYRLGLVRRQADCIRLADATIFLGAAVMLLARTRAAPSSELDHARCELYCHLAIARSSQLLEELETPADELVDRAY